MHRPLESFSPEEWEALCDGCGKCCLHKLEDEDTGKIYFTNVACRLLDTTTGRCKDYMRRSLQVPDCLVLTPELLRDPRWLPSTCAYRRLAEGRALPRWHPLISSDPASVLRSGHSTAGRVISETEADDLEQHIVTWIR
jgi:uncharacterized cysteine cluster protein YcgN (CxxCxxCC family)